MAEAVRSLDGRAVVYHTSPGGSTRLIRCGTYGPAPATYAPLYHVAHCGTYEPAPATYEPAPATYEPFYHETRQREYPISRPPRRVVTVPHTAWADESRKDIHSRRNVAPQEDHSRRKVTPLTEEEVFEEEQRLRMAEVAAAAPSNAQPRIRHVHLQGDDVVVEITGAKNYEVQLKTRRADVVLDAHHPSVLSMNGFKMYAQLPHAEERLLGARVRALRPDGGAGRGSFFSWSPWHTCGHGKFIDEPDSGYTAPPYGNGAVILGFGGWSADAPWRSEVFGGDDPIDRESAEGQALRGSGTPGPGAYNTPSFLQFGGGIADGRGFDYTPSASFASNTSRRPKAQDLWRSAPPPDMQGPPPRSAHAGYRTYSHTKSPSTPWRR